MRLLCTAARNLHFSFSFSFPLCTRTASTRVFIRSSHSNKIRRLPFSSPRRIPSVVGGTNIRKNRTRLSSFPLSFSSFFLRSTFACQRPTPCCVSSAHRDLRILKYLSNSNRKLANRDDFFFYLSLRESSYFPRRLKRPILDYLFKRKFCR